MDDDFAGKASSNKNDFGHSFLFSSGEKKEGHKSDLHFLNGEIVYGTTSVAEMVSLNKLPTYITIVQTKGLKGISTTSEY